MRAYWDIIDLPFQTPWFVVSFLEMQFPQHEGELKRRTKLVHRLDHLENFIASLEADSTNIEDVQVLVVMPGYMTGRTRWTMKPLKAILSGLIPGSTTKKFDVFETSDGSRFAEYMSSASLGCIQMSTRLMISSDRIPSK
jgi:hypothetical protein